MQLDDTKHKVYIYDLDAELSSCPSSPSSYSDTDESNHLPLPPSHDNGGSGRLVFLPDIERHLLRNRIPASVLASRDGELAGLDMQMVLYREPAALSVPEEQDSVRRAVAEARARARARALQRAAESDAEAKSGATTSNSSSASSSSKNGAAAIRSETTSPMPSSASSWRESQAAAAASSNGGGDDDDDPDAMDMD
ncbi:hypothetical protein F4809DRAFT_598903 [Biscogniauxia mediterranea]|nr:hypothetical protein F4809DRAFT_598903 [Biscogniauxia mediterranea]